MNDFAIVIHGGASEETEFLKNHILETEEGLKEAVQAGYKVLKRGGSALAAVEKAVIFLEDNPFFNAGRGSALNCKGEVEMDASIMDGKKLRAGAVSMVREVKNPVFLARTIMDKTKHVFLSGYGALEFAKSSQIILEPEAYFVTDHQYEEFLKLNDTETLQKIMKKKIYGTVGAVALDKKGNLAAATSTGGTSNCLPGRIGDSCVIGGGCYANNNTCAISGTGEGEILIVNAVAHTISMFMELKKYKIQKACDYVIHKRDRPERGNIGVIGIDPQGNIGVSFCSEIMKRAWVDTNGHMEALIY